MLETLHHECGLGMIRLRKDPQYYQDKYGSPLWGLRKMYLMMEKQNNRGQDGAGLATVRLRVPPGTTYIARERIFEPSPPWPNLIKKIEGQLNLLYQENSNTKLSAEELYQLFPFAGELLLGHVRYGTYGANSLESCHPVLRLNNWKTRTLVLAGNFNLTNVDDQFNKLIELGQHPRDRSDTVTALERVGHFIDDAVQDLFETFKSLDIPNNLISQKIADELPTLDILKKSAKYWDGGFTIGGLIGHGDFFTIRDPWGIRPAYYFINDEVAVVASERGAIVSAFDIAVDEVKEFPPAHALIINRNNEITLSPYTSSKEKSSCSFERIYFSRANDPDIYNERKALGRLLTPQVLEAINYDLENTVFSYVPNSAVVAFRGLAEGLQDYVLENNLKTRVRAEHIVWKDTSLRTFITNDASRKDMVSGVYNVTYGVVKHQIDNLVIMDDSIVRGTTLKESLLKIVSRLKPRHIFVVSSSPQIRYPDCYGIDMSNLGHFVAFQAAIELLKTQKKEYILELVYENCLEAIKNKNSHSQNFIKQIYQPFTEEEISLQIASMLYSEELQCGVSIIFQKLEHLPFAIPHHTGDWYFSGNYPTPGGYKVVNQSFINYYTGFAGRAY